MRRIVKGYAPATVSNLGCAFDILGLAIERPGDEVVARRSGKPGIRITKIRGDGGRLPKRPDLNTAGVAVQALIAAAGRSDEGIEIEVHKGLPLGSGLGSSAASAAAAVVAANRLLGDVFDRSDLLPFVLEAEEVACGSGHADNAAPSLLGGISLIRSYQPLEVVALPVPDSLWCAVAQPELEIRTEEARRVLPSTVALSKAIRQWGNIAALVAGISAADYGLIGRSMEDHIVEPARSRLIPGFAEVRQAALDSGALGCHISGSGPAMFALADRSVTAKRAAAAMAAAFRRRGIGCSSLTSKVDRRGARILEESDSDS